MRKKILAGSVRVCFRGKMSPKSKIPITKSANARSEKSKNLMGLEKVFWSFRQK
jgi:hypothetical protein